MKKEKEILSNLDIEVKMTKLFTNTKSISEIIYKNKNIDEARRLLHCKDSEVNLTVKLLIIFQVQLKEYIESCQNRINELIFADTEEIK